MNADLGGVSGRPLRLEACATRGTPESSPACATKLVGGRPGGRARRRRPGLGRLAAGVREGRHPLRRVAPPLGEELTSDGRVDAGRRHRRRPAGPGRLRPRHLKVKRVGALYVDLPGVLTTVVRAAEIVLQAKGVTDVKLVAAKADEADFTPALKAATAGEPGRGLRPLPGPDLRPDHAGRPGAGR